MDRTDVRTFCLIVRHRNKTLIKFHHPQYTDSVVLLFMIDFKLLGSVYIVIYKISK